MVVDLIAHLFLLLILLGLLSLLAAYHPRAGDRRKMFLVLAVSLTLLGSALNGQAIRDMVNPWLGIPFISWPIWSQLSVVGLYFGYRFLRCLDLFGSAAGRVPWSGPQPGRLAHLLATMGAMAGSFLAGYWSGRPIFTDDPFLAREAGQQPHLLIYELAFLAYSAPLWAFALQAWRGATRRQEMRLVTRLRAAFLFAAVLSVLSLNSWIGAGILEPYFGGMLTRPIAPIGITGLFSFFWVSIALFLWVPKLMKRWRLSGIWASGVDESVSDAYRLYKELSDLRLDLSARQNDFMLFLAERLCRELGLAEEQVETTIGVVWYTSLSVPRRLTIHTSGQVSGPVSRVTAGSAASVVTSPFEGRLEYYGKVWRLSRHCTENYDGSGYPLGLAGEGIPIECRISSVLNCYCNRSLTDQEARAELELGNGCIYDPQVVDALFKVLNQIRNE